MGTGSGADANGPGGVAVGNKANGVMGAGGVGGIGAGKASFVAKTNFRSP